MSYLTVEVEIDHGRIVPREPEKLPEHGSGFLTVLSPGLPGAGLCPTRRTTPRPIGLAKGEFTVPDDFNAPLAGEIVRSFEGK
jgi:hypothetical protein